MRISFAIAMPSGREGNVHLPKAMMSLAAQSVDVLVAFCDVSDSDVARKTVRKFKSIIGYSRFGPDDGQSAAIKEGWEAVNADIYGWLNTDDFLAPDALAIVADIFSGNPEIDIVYGQSVIQTPDGVGRLHSAVEPMSDLIFRSNIISQPSCFFRKSILDKVGGIRPDLHFTMDWDLWMRFRQADAKFKFIPEILSIVSWYEGTKTASLDRQRLDEIRALTKPHNNLRRRLQTQAGFMIEHCADYGPFKGLFSYFRKNLRNVKRRPEQIFGDNFKSQQLRIFHYDTRPKRQLILNFNSQQPRTISLNDKVVFRGLDKAVTLEIKLLPAKVLLCEIDSATVPSGFSHFKLV